MWFNGFHTKPHIFLSRVDHKEILEHVCKTKKM